MWYHNSALYAGFAISHLNQPTIGGKSQNKQSVDSVQYGSVLTPHMTGVLGYANWIWDIWLFSIYKSGIGRCAHDSSYSLCNGDFMCVSHRGDYGARALDFANALLFFDQTNHHTQFVEN